VVSWCKSKHLLYFSRYFPTRDPSSALAAHRTFIAPKAFIHPRGTRSRDKDMTEHKMRDCGPANAVYGLGAIGAAVYFIQEATTVGMGLLGLLKALVWPAFVVYGVLKYLGM